MSLEKTTILDLAKYITVIGGCLAALYGGGNWVYNTLNLIATKEYHNAATENQLEPVLTSVEQIEASVLVPRIKNILDLKCANNGVIPEEVESILQRSINRYQEIEKRTYNVGRCKNGQRVTNYYVEGEDGS